MTALHQRAAFATAIQPDVPETVIATPADGLRHGDVCIETPTGSLPVFHAAPAGDGPFPIVLVIQEIFGVHEHIRDVVRRFAHAGYLAVAPELFFRLGRAQDARSVDELRSEFVAKAPDSTVMSDLDACLHWAQAHGGDPERAAATGFCWGGRITWLYAAHQRRLRAGVAWYGKLASPSDPLHPSQPADVTSALKAPVLGLYGGQDTSIPLADVERVRAAVRPRSDIHVYPAASHAFFADYRPSYRPEDARDGWQRLLAWFQRHGV